MRTTIRAILLSLPPINALTAIWYLMRYVILILKLEDTDSLLKDLPVIATSSLLTIFFWLFLPKESFFNFSLRFVMSILLGMNAALNSMVHSYN